MHEMSAGQASGPLAEVHPGPAAGQAAFLAQVRAIPRRVAAWALLAATGAGILAQLLFFGQLPGINFVIWVAAVLLAAAALRPADSTADRFDLWLPLAALAFSGFIWLRDDGPLVLFDVLAAGSLTLAAVAALTGHRVTRAGFAGAVRLGGAAVLVAWVGAVRLSPGLRPIGAAVRPGSNSTTVRIVRGLLIALPLLLLFVALFAAADAVFESYLHQVVSLNLDWGQLIGRVALALLAGWVFAGTMACGWLTSDTDASTTAEQQRSALFGDVEALVVIVALDAIFALFVALQAAYLFGGADTLAVSGMTYSDYARRGFFELIAVALLAGGVILALEALAGARTAAYRIAAVGLVALTGVVLVSALVRLGMYQAAYGWTELRFYALAAIGWLAVGVVTTIAALLVDRVAVVWRAMLGAGLAVALLCNVIGPQAFVTGQNVARALDPSLVAPGGATGLDLGYLGSLGADAIPVLVDDYAALAPADQASVSSILASRKSRLADQVDRYGWPSWNLARNAALDSLTGAGY
jgi:hypothetical protein